VFAAGFSWPASACAQRIWSEGTPDRPLSVDALQDTAVGSVRGAPGAALKRAVLWEYSPPGSEYFEPFSVQQLANGNVLIASRSNEILEVTRGKRIVWSYTRLADDPSLVNAYSAQRLPDGNTLITDRRADFVIEVTPDKQVVWRYGARTDSTDAGCLMDPFSATRLPNGNTLITDNRFGTRVIEVRSSDYDPTQPDLGYTDDSIVWQYGTTGQGGIGPGQLASPRFAQRLSNGNTLIVDSADQVFAGHRVIEVTPSGDISWQFGTAGVAGQDETHLYQPCAAQRLASGNTVIAEEGGRRILEVDTAGRIVEMYGPGEIYPENGTFGNVRSFYRLTSGATLVADQGDQRIVEYGYPNSGTVTSRELSLGLPGVKKTIDRIEAIGEFAPGTSLSLAYSLDGGEWVNGGSPITLPVGSTATQLRYRITLQTDSAAYTPVVREVRVTYDVVPAETTPPSGGTSTGGGTTGGAGRPGRTRGQGVTSGSKHGGIAGGPAVGGTGTGVPGMLPGTGRGTQSTFASGTLLDVVPLSGPDGIGLGALGDGAGPDAVAFGLLLVGIAYAAGVVGSPATGAARTALRFARTRLGRSAA